jgi:hypothetical protein
MIGKSYVKWSDMIKNDKLMSIGNLYKLCQTGNGFDWYSRSDNCLCCLDYLIFSTGKTYENFSIGQCLLYLGIKNIKKGYYAILI